MDFTSINKKGDKVNIHWYLTVADPAVRGGEKNMKSMWSPLVAIFFMTYFYRAGGGGHGPLGPPPGSATV